MTRRATTTRKVEDEPVTSGGGGFGSVLRGSVNSVVGAAGLNLPLRAVERLTTAIENVSAVLQRLDDDFLDRAYETFDILAAMRDDTQAINQRMVMMEEEVRELRNLITQRFDQVPLLRRRRASKSPSTPAP
jgi:2-polyprenyl-6-methoxyphenol hydroxylase-like FAD-dependent oxidoreductase